MDGSTGQTKPLASIGQGFFDLRKDLSGNWELSTVESLVLASIPL